MPIRPLSKDGGRVGFFMEFENDAGEGTRERHRQRGDSTEHADTAPASGLALVLNLGSRDGAGPAQTFDGRYQRAGLFL